MKTVSTSSICFLIGIQAASAQPCDFDMKAQKYAGTELEQARCLLPGFQEPQKCKFQPVPAGGVCRGQTISRTSLEEPLESLVGQTVTVSKQNLKQFLIAEKQTELSKNVDKPLSTTELGTPARYFVIHDTSSNVDQKPWPADTDARMVKLGSKWPISKEWKAHAWVNRLGRIRMTYDFGRRPTQPSTKFENDHKALYGLYLHTEVTQPRKAPPGHPKTDIFVPVPAFKDPQYRSTALLYLVASVRAGKWLVPAYHVAVDHPKGHDDPQYFSLEQFSAELGKLINIIDQ